MHNLLMTTEGYGRVRKEAREVLTGIGQEFRSVSNP